MSTPLTYPTGRGHIELLLGNIVAQQADAIVNAANTKLSGGGGVDGAIHRAAGKELQRECQLLPADEKGRRCPTGEVRVTGAGKLDAAHVIHAVGPFYNPHHVEKAATLLRSAYQAVLLAAEERACRVIAVPAISTGAYRYPLEPAVQIAVEVVRSHLQEHDLPQVVRFVCLKESVFAAFRAILEGASATA